MLGWEFPPHISGGLGTACQGIVSALGKIPDTKIIFLVPKVFGDEKSKNTVFVGANRYAEQLSTVLNRKVKILEKPKLTYVETESFLRPYLTEADFFVAEEEKENEKTTTENKTENKTENQTETAKVSTETIKKSVKKFEFTGKYTENLYTETAMYAKVAEQIAQNFDFDVIHAHDWLTYEAGIAIKKATGKPLVIHVHATEFDRSNGMNETVLNIEKHGMQEADKVVTVSNLTKEIVEEKYEIPKEKIQTVYNAVSFRPVRKKTKYKKDPKTKIVTFLGRITYQKGPEYFLRAAYKVLQKTDNVRFVMAGNGDMYREMIRMSAHLGIADRFHFTDFLDKDEVKQMFSISDVYVMPSVSEPFGIAPLEAVRSGVPVIISNQSGVAEVLESAVKIDYWDVNAMADAIYGLVKYPALSKFFKRRAEEQVKKMKWDKPAADLNEIYKEVVLSASDEEKDVKMNVGHRPETTLSKQTKTEKS